MQSAPADAATAAIGNDAATSTYVNGTADRFPDLQYQSLHFLEQVKFRLGATSKAAIDIHNHLFDFSAGKASKRDTYFTIFGLLGNDVELRNGLQAVLMHQDASWAEQDFEHGSATAPGRQSVPDILEPQHEPQFTLPSMMQSWRTPSINPDMLTNEVGGQGAPNGDLPSFHLVDPFQVGPEHVQSYHSNGHQDYQPVVPSDNTSVQHFAIANSQAMLASEHQPHTMHPAAHEPPHQYWDRTLPSLPRPMVSSQRSYSLNETLSAVQYHHGRQSWVDDAFYEPQRSFSVFETPRMSVPQLDSPNKSSLELSPSIPHTPNQTMFASVPYEPTPKPHVESATNNYFQNGWQAPEQNHQPHTSDQEFFKQQQASSSAHNEQAWSPRDTEHLAIQDPEHTEAPVHAISPQPSPIQDTNAGQPSPHIYVHSLCGKAFATRQGVKKHHWGGRIGNRETVTGCWAKNGKPDVEWDDHPSCKDSTAKSSVPKSTSKQVRPSKPMAPVAPSIFAHNTSHDMPAPQQPPRVAAENLNNSPQLPFREAIPVYHNHHLPLPEPPGISNALLTAVNVASDINAPKAEIRNDSVVQHLDARAPFHNQVNQFNQDTYIRNSTVGFAVEHPIQYHGGYRPLAPAPPNPSLRGGSAIESLSPTALQYPSLVQETPLVHGNIADFKRTHEQVLDQPAIPPGDSYPGALSTLHPHAEGPQNKRRRSAVPEMETKSLIVKLKVNFAKWGSVGVPAAANVVNG